VRGLRVELALNEFLHRDPLTIEVQLSTPRAQAEELLEVVQSRHQSSSEYDHGNRPQQNDARLQEALVPAAEMIRSEDQAR